MALQRVYFCIPVILCLIFLTSYTYGNIHIGNSHSQLFQIENCTNLQNLNADDCTLCSCTLRRPTFTSNFHSDCVITEDVMLHLLSLLQNAWNIITGTFSGSLGSRRISKHNAENETSCMRNAQTLSHSPKNLKLDTNWIMDSCEDIVDDIENLIINLTEQIRLLVGWLDDPENLNPRIAQLEECLRCVNRKLDDTMAQYDQQLGNITEQMGEMQQCFTLVILERKQEIQQLQLRLEAKSYDLIRNSVNASSYATALGEFVRLNNETILDTLITDIYASSKVENLLRFAYLLPQQSQRIKMYVKLINTMQTAGHHLTMHMISFSKIFYDDVTRVCGNKDFKQCAQPPSEYIPILTLVDIFLKHVKISLAKEICASNTFNMLKSASPEASTNLAGQSFHEILDDLIVASYERCPDDFTEIIKFAHDLRWNKHKLQAFTTLFRIARNNNERLQIAIKMKFAIENLFGPDGGNVEDIRDAFSALKDRLPANIRNIVWHSACNLGNKDFVNEWLSIDKSHGYGNSRIFTKPNNETKAMWIFKEVERDNLDYEFLIENAQTGEYLGSHIPWKNWNDERGITAAHYPDYDEFIRYQYSWQIHITDNSFIQLFHVGRQAYLQALDDKDGQFHHVFLELSARGLRGTNWEPTCNN